MRKQRKTSPKCSIYKKFEAPKNQESFGTESNFKDAQACHQVGSEISNLAHHIYNEPNKIREQTRRHKETAIIEPIRHEQDKPYKFQIEQKETKKQKMHFETTIAPVLG